MLEFLGFSCIEEGSLKHDTIACSHEEDQRIPDPMADVPAHLDTIRTWQHSTSRANKREAGFCGVPNMRDFCDGEEEDVRMESIIESLPVLMGSDPVLVEKTMSSHSEQSLTEHMAFPLTTARTHLSGQTVMAAGDFEESDEESVIHDADFGLSDEQLQKLEEACQGPVIRNLTGSMQEELVRTDSEFGISDRQLQGLAWMKAFPPL